MGQCEKRCRDVVQLAQCAGRPENEASEPYRSHIGVPLKGFLLKNAYHFLQQKGWGFSILCVKTACHLRSQRRSSCLSE